MAHFHIGVDLGGTKIEAVLLRLPDGQLLSEAPSVASLVAARERWDTEAHQGYDHIVYQVVGMVRSLLAGLSGPEQAQATVGIGLPGHISRRSGVVKNSNTVCLNGRDLWGDVRRALERPVEFDNDANCLTLAEATFGAARGAEVVFGVILGTGVGGGIAFRGEVWSGLQGIAGEWGHSSLSSDGPPCYCGRRGCIETYLSGPALEHALRVQASLNLTSKAFHTALKEGSLTSPRALEVWRSYLSYFGQALSQVVNVLDPEVVVIGGGLSQIASLYTEGVAALRRHVFNDELLTSVVPASLGDAGGVYGAVLIGAASRRAHA